MRMCTADLYTGMCEKNAHFVTTAGAYTYSTSRLKVLYLSTSPPCPLFKVEVLMPWSVRDGAK